MKTKIKSIPLIGWFVRWTYNLLRLNNLKHTVFQQQKQIEQQKKELNKQQKQILQLQKQMKQVLTNKPQENMFDSKQSQQIFTDIKESIKLHK